MKAPSRIATAGDGGEVIIGEVFGSPLRRQILKLHLLGQHGSHDLQILVRPRASDLLNHFDAVGVEVVCESL
jgi:hypothetical protein